MVATSNARPARKTSTSTGSPIAVGHGPALGYVRLYRRVALVRNELLMNIVAASRTSPAGAR